MGMEREKEGERENINILYVEELFYGLVSNCYV